MYGHVQQLASLSSSLSSSLPSSLPSSTQLGRAAECATTSLKRTDSNVVGVISMSMIGVSNRARSKGCLTCRQRKVKCDEGRPICNRCKNGYFDCLGYVRPLLFVNEGTALQRPPARAATASQLTSAKSRENNSNLDVDVQTLLSARSYLSADDLPIHQSLHLNAFKENILISHLLKNLFVEFADSGNRGDNHPWILYAIQRRNANCASYMAALALAAAFFGRKQQEKTVYEQGARTYGQALRQLKADLDDPERAVTYFTMSSTLLLSIYEVVTFSNISGWLEHFNGIGVVTQLAGPYAFQTRPAIEVFATNRTFIVLNSLVRKKRCFLEQDIWKTIPWALDPSLKFVGMYLQDILCDIPGFLEESQIVHGLLSSAEDITALQRPLRGKVNASLHNLYRLRQRWEHEFPQACYELWPSASETLCVDDEGCPLFPSVFHFWSIHRAHEIGLYDAMLLLLLNLLQSLDEHTGREPSKIGDYYAHISLCQPTNPLLLPGQGTHTDIALEICRLVDYHLLGKEQNTGALVLLFPLKMAYRNLDRNSREVAWLSRIMQRIADVNGFEMGRHVLRDVSIEQR